MKKHRKPDSILWPAIFGETKKNRMPEFINIKPDDWYSIFVSVADTALLRRAGVTPLAWCRNTPRPSRKYLTIFPGQAGRGYKVSNYHIMGGNKMQGDDFTLQPTNDMNPPEQPLLPAS